MIAKVAWRGDSIYRSSPRCSRNMFQCPVAGFIRSSNLMEMLGIRQKASLVSQDLADISGQKEISALCYLALLLRNCVNFASKECH